MISKQTTKLPSNPNPNPKSDTFSLKQMPTSDLILSFKQMCKSGAQIQQVHAHAITTALFSLDPSLLLDHILHSFASSPSSSPSTYDLTMGLFDEMPRSLRNKVTYATMIDGLCKAGYIDHARELFDEMPMSIRNVVSYNAMLMGLAMHGHNRVVLEQYLSRMVEDGFKPDGMIILAVLVGCSHSGLINDAKRIFMEMESVYGVPREIQHYGCMVDLLARAGLIKEAKEVIEGMQMEGESYAYAWGALLGGCKTYGDVEVAEEAARHIRLATPEDGAVFSSLAHIYANLGQWDKVAKVRRLRGRPGVKKRRGCCTIELDGITHKFFSWRRLLERDMLGLEGFASTTSIHKLGKNWKTM